MADEPQNLLLEYMKRFDQRLSAFDSKLDRVLNDVHDLKVRMSNVEEAVVGIHRRLDRVDLRLDRIERRLELIDAPPGVRE